MLPPLTALPLLRIRRNKMQLNPEVKIVADSLSARGVRITSFQLKYWRAIHAEFMTHRMFCRNASSSRAIPFSRMLDMVRKDPWASWHIGKNQPGMQANDEVDAVTKDKFYVELLELSNIVANYVERWGDEYSIHKQVVNRYLEPFGSISVVVTATDWQNFFFLRDHRAAEPNIRRLAETMSHEFHESTPVKRNGTFDDPNAWHLPYITDEERNSKEWTCEDLRQFSGARCARVSFNNHDQTAPSPEKDRGTYAKLISHSWDEPDHQSPLEHQAFGTALRYHGNLYGWASQRFYEELKWSNLPLSERIQSYER